MIRLFFEAVGRGTVTLGGFDAEWAQPTYKIVRVAVVAFGLIVAYPYIPGSQSEAFKGVSLFIGIVFSLGSSSAISNIIAGYMMTYRRAFKVGDRVKIGEAIGDVIEMRLQVTHLRSLKNEEIVIPNSQILSGEVLNYSSLARDARPDPAHGSRHRLRDAVAAGRGDAAGRRRRARRGLAAEPRPFVLIKRLGDFAVTYELNVPCRDVPAMAALYTALHQKILDVFNEHGVQIMTPAYEGDPRGRRWWRRRTGIPPRQRRRRDTKVLALTTRRPAARSPAHEMRAPVSRISQRLRNRHGVAVANRGVVRRHDLDARGVERVLDARVQRGVDVDHVARRSPCRR